MKRLMILLGIFIASGFFLKPAIAQNWAPSSGPNPQKERVQSLILMRLSTSLGLDQAQTQQLGGVMARYRDRKHQLRSQLRDQTAQLRSINLSGNDPQIQSLLTQIERTRKELDGVDEQMFGETRRMLSPQQQAQFILVMDEIRREVKAVRGQGSGPGMENPYRPGGAFFPSPQNPQTLPGNANTWVK